MLLFREEVMRLRGADEFGSVRLHRPFSFTVVTCLALGLGCALLAFTAWGEVNRKTRVVGLLVPILGSSNITTQQAGVVLELPVTEGQHIKAGQVLAVLHTERSSMLGGTLGDTSARIAIDIETRQQTLRTESTLRELQTRQRTQVLTDRIRTVQAEVRQADEERALQVRRVALAKATLIRNEQLASDGFIAPAQVQTRQEELIDADGRLQSAERTRLSLQHDLQALEGERASLAAQLKSDINLIERNRATLSQEKAENAARTNTVVTAPFTGTVTALGIQAGASVQAGQTLGTLVPQAASPDGKTGSPATAQLQAQLFAPSHTAGFVRPGQTVYLRYAAYPYQKFGLHTGHITTVSATPFAPNELPPNLTQQLMSQVGSTEALYRINVRLDAQDIQVFGESLPLKVGLTLEADVLQERRKVWEWVLEPVLAARQQIKVLGAEPGVVRKGG